MNAQLAMIVRRREALVARAAVQREALAVHTAGLRPLLSIGNVAMRIGRAGRAHPALAAVAVMTLVHVVNRRHRVLMWAGRAFTVWQLYWTVRTKWTQVRPEPRRAAE